MSTRWIIVPLMVMSILVSAAPEPVEHETVFEPQNNPYIQIGNGEYQNFLLDLDGTPYGIGGNLLTLGSGNVGLYGGANRVLTSPTNLKFTQVAGVLHGGMGIDVNGYVWTWGDGSGGQIGDGNFYSNAVTTPVKLTTDNSSQPFNNIKFVVSGLGSGVPIFAIKNDGTLWGWGGLYGGLTGDGTDGLLAINPRQIPVPGVPAVYTVKQIAVFNVLIVLRSDGTVWTCGGAGGNEEDLGYHKSNVNDYRTLHNIGLTDIATVAGGASFSYALANNGSLWGWGYYGHHLGYTCGYCPIPKPTMLWGVMGAFPAGTQVAQISTNHVATYAILTDGSLWGWGDNAAGNLGIGCELDYLHVTGEPYSWDFGQDDFPVYQPVRIVPSRSDFVGLSYGNPFVFYKNAITSDNTIYAMGRNKGGVIGNGVLACSSDQDATNPNGHDITVATIVNPLALTANDIVTDTMPYCALVDRNHPTCTSSNCNRAGIVFGADHIPLPATGLYQGGCLNNFGRTGRCNTSVQVNAICQNFTYNDNSFNLTSSGSSLLLSLSHLLSLAFLVNVVAVLAWRVGSL